MALAKIPIWNYYLLARTHSTNMNEKQLLIMKQQGQRLRFGQSLTEDWRDLWEKVEKKAGKVRHKKHRGVLHKQQLQAYQIQINYLWKDVICFACCVTTNPLQSSGNNSKTQVKLCLLCKLVQVVLHVLAYWLGPCFSKIYKIRKKAVFQLLYEKKQKLFAEMLNYFPISCVVTLDSLLNTERRVRMWLTVLVANWQSLLMDSPL